MTDPPRPSCLDDVYGPSVETVALMQKNYRFLLRSVERALEGKPFEKEEEERDEPTFSV